MKTPKPFNSNTSAIGNEYNLILKGKTFSVIFEGKVSGRFIFRKPSEQYNCFMFTPTQSRTNIFQINQ